MGVANVFNNFCSGTYAALIDNMFIWAQTLWTGSYVYLQAKTPDLIEDVGDEGSFSVCSFPLTSNPRFFDRVRSWAFIALDLLI
ncbi:hypothetical protein GQ600_12193 [Phytophthora cactorum]|nr:hypothetical protein GQ600_12193 [Phytophthora cactorum]